MIEEKKDAMIESVKVKEENTNDNIANIKAKIEENELKIPEADTKTEEKEGLKKHNEELNHDITDLEKLMDKDVLKI